FEKTAKNPPPRISFSNKFLYNGINKVLMYE
ncbi:unnamed protein product, partial [marine sediment metagenome]